MKNTFTSLDKNKIQKYCFNNINNEVTFSKLVFVFLQLFLRVNYINKENIIYLKTIFQS